MKHIRSVRHAFAVSTVLGSLLAASNASATSSTLDAPTCRTNFGGTWVFNSCSVTNFVLTASDKLSVPSGVALILNGTNNVVRGELTIETGGALDVGIGDALDNHGSIEVHGSCDNDGTIQNLDDGSLVIHGTLTNEGEIDNVDPGTRLRSTGGVITNYGTISNQAASAKILNHEQAMLKNRDGALIEILDGELENEDSTITNQNDSVIDILDSGKFTNTGVLASVLNRETGSIFVDGKLTNEYFADIGSYGWFENRGTFINATSGFFVNEDGAFFSNQGALENRDDGAIDNAGDFFTSGSFDNYCLGWLTNAPTGVLSGAFNNWDGTALNSGSWAPGPTQKSCKHKT